MTLHFPHTGTGGFHGIEIALMDIMRKLILTILFSTTFSITTSVGFAQKTKDDLQKVETQKPETESLQNVFWSSRHSGFYAQFIAQRNFLDL